MTSLLYCPYCCVNENISKTNVPHTVGKYKVKLTEQNWLIFKCVRCNKIFKMRVQGSLLRWADMSREEQHMFNKGGK